MRFVIQRVSEASVKIDNVIYSEIQKGFLVLVGVEEADTKEDADWLCQKINWHAHFF
jgi:D-tyrosyl-tRNA(Tyr) deacylase